MNNDTTTPAAIHPAGKLAYATPANAPMVERAAQLPPVPGPGRLRREQRTDARAGDVGHRGHDQAHRLALSRVRRPVRLRARRAGVDLEFEDGQSIRLQAGESLYIPGGLRHNEIATSDTLEILEVSVPADMGTVACEAPEGR